MSLNTKFGKWCESYGWFEKVIVVVVMEKNVEVVGDEIWVVKGKSHRNRFIGDL